MAQLNDMFVEGSETHIGDSNVIYLEDHGNATPYADTSDDKFSKEEVGGSGELFRKDSKYLRFNKKDPVLKFFLGMKFNGKRQFKKVIIKYALVERRVIKFIKGEGDRVSCP